MMAAFRNGKESFYQYADGLLNESAFEVSDWKIEHSLGPLTSASFGK